MCSMEMETPDQLIHMSYLVYVKIPHQKTVSVSDVWDQQCGPIGQRTAPVYLGLRHTENTL